MLERERLQPRPRGSRLPEVFGPRPAQQEADHSTSGLEPICRGSFRVIFHALMVQCWLYAQLVPVTGAPDDAGDVCGDQIQLRARFGGLPGGT